MKKDKMKTDVTPFRVIVHEDESASIVLGNYLIKKNIKNEDEAIDLIENKDWEVILTACASYMQWISREIESNKKSQEENEETENI